MMHRMIRNTGPTTGIIRNTGPTERRIEPSELAAALGAEPTGERIDQPMAPMSLVALRTEVMGRSQSSSSSQKAMIRIDAGDWADVEKLVEALVKVGINTSPAQVVRVLLRRSVQSMLAQTASESTIDLVPLAAELAASVEGG